ncbi:MAG: dihydroneopterin aldolase [Candidatus Pelagibacter sp.]|nr:dihydroneopterin aldolase [Candidatus Pelagibacter sp.]|tara:strand:- start:49986 stop:50387 length:402 start_codon:yes stop_codon:yes gene_type:complete
MNKKNNIIQLNKSNLNEVRKIVIKDLIINTKFGYYEKEKKKNQRLRFNIEIEVFMLPIDDKSIKNIIDYDKIIKIIEIILSKHINFLESLSEEICSEVLKDQRVKNISLQIDKLDIIKKTSSVGVKTFKERIK